MDPQKTWGNPRFLDALTFAMKLHGSDLRKGTSLPYIAHILGVCSLVLYDGGSEDEAIAALLHDALEDHPGEISRETILQRFGQEVLSIIESCTDTPADYKGGPKPPWKERKTTYLEHLRTADQATLRVGLADKLDNARSILADYRKIGEDLWSRFNVGREEQLWYYRSLVQIFREAGMKGFMIDELEYIVECLEREH
ncbi:MAG: HD domain-containing protein [Calditrichia bacterium]